MNLYLLLLAFIAGAAIAAQASMNAQLGVMLNSSILASMFAFLSGLLFISVYFVLTSQTWPNQQQLIIVPTYLWFAGGLLSAFAITSFYWLIPQLGVNVLISVALTGQLVFSMLAAHFGWFELPVATFTPLKLLGSLSLLLGIVLVNL
ncbi:MAG: DMT family transporter [Gammaproteobacteria bacterium]|nr:DMT family transporter [Gammaproteobacteria bacterium]